MDLHAYRCKKCGSRFETTALYPDGYRILCKNCDAIERPPTLPYKDSPVLQPEILPSRMNYAGIVIASSVGAICIIVASFSMLDFEAWRNAAAELVAIKQKENLEREAARTDRLQVPESQSLHESKPVQPIPFHKRRTAEEVQEILKYTMGAFDGISNVSVSISGPDVLLKAKISASSKLDRHFIADAFVRQAKSSFHDGTPEKMIGQGVLNYFVEVRFMNSKPEDNPVIKARKLAEEQGIAILQ